MLHEMKTTEKNSKDIYVRIKFIHWLIDITVNSRDIRHLFGASRAASYIDGYVILGVNYSCFIIVGTKNAVYNIEGILYRELTLQDLK
jgi:hypothetical protein